MPRKVTLYTDNGELSTLARNYLKENNVTFKEVNVKEERNKQIAINTTRIPFLVVKASHEISTVSGFDEFRYASALNPSSSYDKWMEKKSDHPISYVGYGYPSLS